MDKKDNENDLMTAVYPEISDELIKCLQNDFPDRLPRKCIDMYELGILAGQQQVIDKLVMEKRFGEGEKNGG